MLGNSHSPCPFCGKALVIAIERARSDEVELDEGEGDGAAEDDAVTATSVAWEEDEGTSISRFFHTVKEVISAPGKFFRSLDGGEVDRSISFAIAAVLPPLAVQGACVYAIFTYFFDLKDPTVLRRLVLLVPLAAALFVSFLVTFYQAASTIAAQKRPPFGTTLRGTCFGFAPMVLGIVPLVGFVVGLVWSLVLHVIAMRELHHLSSLRATVVVMVPLVVITLSLVYGANS